jgi:hypothetical protein
MMPRLSQAKARSPKVKVAPKAEAATLRKKRVPSIIEVMNDPAMFGPFFHGESWGGWRTILKSVYGLPLSDDELAFFHSIAGGRAPPTAKVREFWAVAGRRAGKDAMASAVAAFTAALFDQQHLLRGGERALVLCLACDRAQARIILNYIKSYFTDIPLLAGMVAGEMTNEGFSLRNGVDIAVGTNSFRGVRGRPILLAILDELAFWRDENSAKPDEELYRALTPSLATLSLHSMIVGISSPYRKAGLLHSKYKRHFGKDEDVLVIQAPTRALNPTIKQEIVDRAVAEDPAAASAEWLGQFRDDIGGWLTLDVIDNAVDRGVIVRAPHRANEYRAFADPSGGRGDSFTMSVAHDWQGLAVLDCVVEVAPPFDPTSAVAQIAATLREYGLSEVTGDRYAAEWVVSAFASCGINYRASDRDRSAIYSDALPLFTSGRARILDVPKLINQFASLERKTNSMGRDKIDHGPGGHDDLCNSAAGALVAASAPDRRPRILFG